MLQLQAEGDEATFTLVEWVPYFTKEVIATATLLNTSNVSHDSSFVSILVDGRQLKRSEEVGLSQDPPL